MNIKVSLLILLFLNGIGELLAQQTIRFETIGLESGLSNMNTTCIIQDSLGYIWVGTDDGLNRFDGYEFTTYTYGSNKKASGDISNNRVFSIVEGDSGALWIGTYDGLNKYDRYRDTFFTFRPSSEKNQTNANVIYALHKSASGLIWVGTGDGLFTFDPLTNLFENLTATHSQFSNQIINTIIEDPTGQIYIGGQNGIHFIENGKVQKLNPSLYSSREVVSLLFDQHNRLWVGHFNSGISMIDLENSSSTFFKSKKDQQTLPDNYVYDIVENAAGDIWIATDNGLSVYDGKGGFRNYYSKEGDIYSLSSNIITDLLIDDSERIWVSTRLGGICIYDKAHHQFNHIKKNGYESGSLSSDKTTGFAETELGDLIIGTDGGGVNFYDEGKMKFTNLTMDNSELSSDKALALNYDSRGDLWIGTWGQGLNRLDKKGKWHHYRHDSENQYSLSDDNIYVIFEDSKSNIWIGTWGNGLCKYDPIKDRFICYVHDPADPSSFAGSAINQIIEDSNGDLLLATEFEGLERFNTQTEKFQHYKVGDEGSISLNALNCILLDSKNRIWVGTNGSGLNLYDRKSDQFQLFTIQDGLPNNVIVGLLEDDLGAIWMSTNRGVSRFDPETGTFLNFDVDDGLQDYQFMPRSSFKRSDGGLVFGGNNGFNLFSPQRIKKEVSKPKVYITNLSLLNQPVEIQDTINAILNKHITFTDTIFLAHDQNFFSLGFTGLNYSNPHKIKYQYLMEGLFNDWVDIGHERSVAFTALAPGTYVFSVRASDDGINWSDKAAMLRIYIHPPWWLTIWAYLGYVCIISLLIYVFRILVIARTNYKNDIKNEKLMRESQEKLNLAKLQFFTNISHELRTPITLITGPVESILESGEIPKKIKNQLQTINVNAQRLNRLVNQIMDFRKSESNMIQLRVGKGNFSKFVSEIKLAFDDLAQSKGVEFEYFASSNDIQLYFDRDQFEKVIFNLLSNAFKHVSAKKGLVKITVQESEKTVILTVEDNGKGISEEDVSHIFERYYIGSSQENASVGTGIGLALAKNLVELHKGEINVESRLNEFARFIVTLQKGSAHFEEKELIKDFKDSEFIGHYHPVETNESQKIPNTNLENREKLLIVEDNDEVREFIKSIFLNQYIVMVARNGQEGFDLAKEEIPDLIISDVMMPILDGITMCKLIKENASTSHIPVLLLTARTSLIYQIEGLEKGANDYLTKPFNSKILKLKVANLLKGRERLHDHFKDHLVRDLSPSELDINSKDELFLQQVLESVERNMSDSNYSIDVLCEEIGMSRMQTYRKLKALTGQSANEFIRIIRLKRAAQLLQSSQYSVSEVTYMVGFNDLQYFRKCFKEYFQKLPSSLKNDN